RPPRRNSSGSGPEPDGPARATCRTIRTAWTSPHGSWTRWAAVQRCRGRGRAGRPRRGTDPDDPPETGCAEGTARRAPGGPETERSTHKRTAATAVGAPEDHNTAMLIEMQALPGDAAPEAGAPPPQDVTPPGRDPAGIEIVAGDAWRRRAA